MSLPPLIPLEEPLGKGTKSCPLCHTGEYLRRRTTITYCLKCMTGQNDSGTTTIDMHLFPGIVEERAGTEIS